MLQCDVYAVDACMMMQWVEGCQSSHTGSVTFLQGSTCNYVQSVSIRSLFLSVTIPRANLRNMSECSDQSINLLQQRATGRS